MVKLMVACVAADGWLASLPVSQPTCGTLVEAPKFLHGDDDDDAAAALGYSSSPRHSTLALGRIHEGLLWHKSANSARPTLHITAPATREPSARV